MFGEMLRNGGKRTLERPPSSAPLEKGAVRKREKCYETLIFVKKSKNARISPKNKQKPY